MDRHGLTEEQLAFFTEQTYRAVNKALRRYVRGAIVAFAILLSGLVLALAENSHSSAVARAGIVKSGTVIAVEGCNRDYRAASSMRGLFIRLRHAVYQQAKEQGLPRDSREVQFAVHFYTEELRRRPLPDCRPATRILSDNPSSLRVPTPLHP